MIHTRDRSSLLKKLNPRSKLWLTLGLILSNVLFKNYYYSILLMIISIIMIVKEKQLTLFKVILVSMTVLFISMYGIHGAMAPIIDKTSDPVMFEIFGINYYAKGFAYASRYYFRVAPLMCSLFLIFLTMDVADLGAVMCKAGIPYRFVFTFIDSFQVITLLNKDMEQIRDAQRARGLNTEGNLIQRFKAFVPIMVPVVANSIVKVQDQAIAMETKGFNSKCSKTVYREIEYCKGDYIVKAVGLILAVLAVGYKICTAVGVIPSFFSNII